MDQHGYPVAAVEGFELSMLVSYGDCGDALVVAPDGSASSLIWATGGSTSFAVAIEPDPTGRWGTFAVTLPLAMTTDAEAQAYLRALLPLLRPYWEEWRLGRS